MNRKNIRTQSKADARTQRTSGGGFMDKVGGIVGGLFNKTPIDAGFDIQSGQAPQFYAKGASKWYATTGGKIGIGVGALVLGVGIYKLTQKK